MSSSIQDRPAADPQSPPSLEQLSQKAQPGFVGELFGFLAENKKWWLLPILLMMGLFALLMMLAGSGAAPFIYTLF